MADSNVTITKYSREAIRQMEGAFQTAGGSAGNNRPSSSNPNAGDPLDALGDAAANATGPLGLLAKTVSGVKGALTGLIDLAGSRGVGLMLGEFKSGLVGGVEALDGGLDSFEDAGDMMYSYAKRAADTFGGLGVSVKAMHEFNTQSRAASINLGGLKEWTGKLKEGQEHYFARIGDNSDAVEHQVEMMNLLTQTGGEAEDLYGTFGKRLDATNDDLLKMGISYKESREHLVGMTKDENIRQRLMSAAGKKERQQILLEVQARFKHLKSLGMTTEQAESASKALAALSGKGPLDRIKEAAKMQAGMSALGIENAEEIARIYRKGDRANDKERETMRVGLGQLQEVQAASRTDLLGRELSVAMISASTGLDKMEKVFSELLGKTGAAVKQRQLDDMKVVGLNTENANKIVSVIDKLNTVMEESWIPEVPKMLGEIKDVGKNMLMAAPLIGTLGIAADGLKAVMTGESFTWDAINKVFPNVAESMSQAVGWFGDHVITLVAGGNKAKEAELRLARNANEENRTAERKKVREEQAETNTKITELLTELTDLNTKYSAAMADDIRGNEFIIKEQLATAQYQLEELRKTNAHNEKMIKVLKPEPSFQKTSVDQ